MTDNLHHWNRFADIDPKFTKPISGKDSGGTSPNPQYVIRCLTEMFGPVGKGFGWIVLAEAFEPLGDTHLHWCRIRFWWRDDQGEEKAGGKAQLAKAGAGDDCASCHASSCGKHADTGGSAGERSRKAAGGAAKEG